MLGTDAHTAQPRANAEGTKYRVVPYTGTKEELTTYVVIQATLDPETMERTLTADEARKELGGDMKAFFIECGGQIVGFVAHQVRTREGGNRYGFIWELVLLEQFRGRGIGRSIVRHIVEEV